MLQEVLVKVNKRPRNFRKIIYSQADLMIRSLQSLLEDSHGSLVQREACDTLASEPWTFGKGFKWDATRGHTSHFIQVELPHRSARSIRRINSLDMSTCFQVQKWSFDLGSQSA